MNLQPLCAGAERRNAAHGSPEDCHDCSPVHALGWCHCRIARHDNIRRAPGTAGMTAFDAIVIGAGQAGPSLAGRLTGAGMKVALVERKLFGGTCVNTGCMPTKTLVASAYAAHLARRGAEYGIAIDS